MIITPRLSTRSFHSNDHQVVVTILVCAYIYIYIYIIYTYGVGRYFYGRGEEICVSFME